MQHGGAQLPEPLPVPPVDSLQVSKPGSRIMPALSKDRLIAALGAQLRAERETRDALADVIANGQLDREVLLAILSDPVPVVTRDEIVRAEAWLRDLPPAFPARPKLRAA